MYDGWREGMKGRGTSRGESNEACRLEYEDVRWGRAGRADGGGKGRGEAAKSDEGMDQ